MGITLTLAAVVYLVTTIYILIELIEAKEYNVKGYALLLAPLWPLLLLILAMHKLLAHFKEAP